MTPAYGSIAESQEMWVTSNVQCRMHKKWRDILISSILDELIDTSFRDKLLERRCELLNEHIKYEIFAFRHRLLCSVVCKLIKRE